MSFIRQSNIGEGYQFSIKAPPDLRKTLDEFAYLNRITRSLAVVHLLSNALKAEEGKPYVTFLEQSKEA
ncbi:MAG: hypothetical protein LBS21_06790 [Clostridiales bacterium]|jgi:hypothetical protein|nr:hypothetical protein [Clostridiales bacterium]